MCKKIFRILQWGHYILSPFFHTFQLLLTFVIYFSLTGSLPDREVFLPSYIVEF